MENILLFLFSPAKLQLFPSTSFLQIPQRPPEPPLYLPQNLPEGFWEAGPHLLYDLFVVRFGEAAGDAGEGVAVAAEPVGHRKTHNGIISEFTSLRKQREIGGLDVVEFVYESYKIKGDKSEK